MAIVARALAAYVCMDLLLGSARTLEGHANARERCASSTEGSLARAATMADGAGDVAIGAQHDVSPVCWFQKYTLPFASGTSAHPSGSGSLSVGSGGGSVGSCGGGGPVRCARSGVLGVPKKDVGVVSGCQRTRSTSPSSSSEHAHSVWPFLTVWRMLSKVWSAPFSSGCAADLAAPNHLLVGIPTITLCT